MIFIGGILRGTCTISLLKHAALFDRMLHVKPIHLAISFSGENKVCISEDHCNEKSHKQLVLTLNA